jgi:hypothetical protein
VEEGSSRQWEKPWGCPSPQVQSSRIEWFWRTGPGCPPQVGSLSSTVTGLSSCIPAQHSWAAPAMAQAGSRGFKCSVTPLATLEGTSGQTWWHSCGVKFTGIQNSRAVGT